MQKAKRKTVESAFGGWLILFDVALIF